MILSVRVIGWEVGGGQRRHLLEKCADAVGASYRTRQKNKQTRAGVTIVLWVLKKRETFREISPGWRAASSRHPNPDDGLQERQLCRFVPPLRGQQWLTDRNLHRRGTQKEDTEQNQRYAEDKRKHPVGDALLGSCAYVTLCFRCKNPTACRNPCA